MQPAESPSKPVFSIPFESLINFIKKGIFANPVLLKELRIGLREKKVFIIQIIYMLVLGFVAFLFLVEISNRSSSYHFSEEGRNFFLTLCTVQLFLVVLVSPSLTSTSISSEKEKQTYDLLIVSLLTPAEIIMGKLAYAASYIFLLLTSSLPIIAIVFFLGSVSPGEILLNYTALFLWGILVSLTALFFSSRESKSANATNQSYGFLILMGIFFIVPYLTYFYQTGQLIGYSTEFPQVLAWLCLYFDILWLFLFLFLKISNNLRPKAQLTLYIHRLFIVGYIINMVGLFGLMVATSYSSSSWNMTLNKEDTQVLWLFFAQSALFFLGCFVERQKYSSKTEEKIFSRSLSSRPWFFPGYFLILGLGIAVILSLLSGEFDRLSSSYGIFAMFLFFMVLFTSDIFKIANGKVRPVFVFYPLLLLMNTFPLFSWIVFNAVTQPSSKKTSFFTFIFVHPVFSMLSLWGDTNQDEFSQVYLGDTAVPTYILTIIFYVMIFISARFLLLMVENWRKSRENQEIIKIK